MVISESPVVHSTGRAQNAPVINGTPVPLLLAAEKKVFAFLQRWPNGTYDQCEKSMNYKITEEVFDRVRTEMQASRHLPPTDLVTTAPMENGVGVGTRVAQANLAKKFSRKQRQRVDPEQKMDIIKTFRSRPLISYEALMEEFPESKLTKGNYYNLKRLYGQSLPPAPKKEIIHAPKARPTGSGLSELGAQCVAVLEKHSLAELEQLAPRDLLAEMLPGQTPDIRASQMMSYQRRQYMARIMEVSPGILPYSISKSTNPSTENGRLALKLVTSLPLEGLQKSPAVLIREASIPYTRILGALVGRYVKIRLSSTQPKGANMAKTQKQITPEGAKLVEAVRSMSIPALRKAGPTDICKAAGLEANKKFSQLGAYHKKARLQKHDGGIVKKVKERAPYGSRKNRFHLPAHAAPVFAVGQVIHSVDVAALTPDIQAVLKATLPELASTLAQKMGMKGLAFKCSLVRVDDEPPALQLMRVSGD